MSTFTLPNSTPECPVHLTKDLGKDQLLAFPAFKNWIKTLQTSLEQQDDKSHTFHEAPYKLRRIDIQSVDFFGPSKDRIGFIKLTAKVTNDNDEYLPGSVFLRGGSVAMLVYTQVRRSRFYDKVTDWKHSLLYNQMTSQLAPRKTST